MKRRISILGSTGSIGRQSLEVIKALGFEAAALTANQNIELLEKQAREFKPELVVVYDKKRAGDLKVRLSDTAVQIGRAHV